MASKEYLLELARQAEAQRAALDRVEALERELERIQSELQNLKRLLFREIISVR